MNWTLNRSIVYSKQGVKNTDFEAEKERGKRGIFHMNSR